MGQWHFRHLQRRHLWTSHSSPTPHQLPRHIFLNLIDGLKSLPFLRKFWEKPEVTGHQIWGVVGLSHLGDSMTHQKTLYEMLWMSRHVVVMKLPVTSCPELWTSESSEYFLWRNVQAKAKLDADSLLYLLILNVTATQYTCSLNGVYHPHWLVQWSHQCSRMCIPVHCPWLPGYINVA